jgi:RHS repeat-associated protein
MRKILNILLLLPILVIAQSPNQNWVKTKTYKDSTNTSIPSPTPAQAVTQVSYFDGLGRPIQQVAHAQSNTGKDIVTHIEYDAFGRPAKEFLPYANQTASLNYNASAGTDVLDFYNTNSYENTPNPFSEKQFEASPLNRVLKQAAPGNAWRMGSGKEIKMDYQTNTANDVKLYKATATWNATLGIYDIALSQTGYYSENQLYKTITYDENAPPSGAGGLEEYKDKEGKVVLKRTFNNSLAHETYYVYDMFGNLTYVIPPLVTSVTAQLEGLCYQYKYDARNRLIEKKLPGKQWEYMVYDKLDRVVATGPAYNPYGGSDTNKGWLLTKYDVFNRPVYTAWYNAAVASSANRKTLQDTYNNATVFSENKTTSATTINGIATKYTNQVSPSAFVVLTVNYYDSYDYPNAPVIPSQIEGQNTQSTNLKGMATGSWVRVLDAASSTSNELSYTVYDTRYRPIRSYTKNYLGGFTQVDSKLDWAGKTEYNLSKHKRAANGPELVIKQRFTYSAQDRLVKHTHEIVGFLAEELIALNTYNELGQLISKKVGGDRSGSSSLQKIDYTYNIRGWLQSINNINNLNPSATERDLFAFKINYNNPETATPLYNGNISETFWRTSSDNVKRKYAYKYDNLNRLLEANYDKPDVSGTLNNYLEKLTYDKGGNILTLERNGNLDPSGGATVNLIDNLIYTYDSSKKNELKKVNDLSNSPQGFNQDNDIASGDVDGNNEDHTYDYTYDFSGNMKTDTNKGINEIIYNHLNLPVFIKLGGTTNGKINYIYNAIGQKVKKVVVDNVANTTTDYLSGFQYKNTELQFFLHSEGYVHFTKPLASQGGANSGLGSFNYVFNYKDHLGNVRVSFANDPLQGNVLKILEENNYYAFGLKHKNYNVEHLDFDQFPETGVEIAPAPAVANASYNYKYNGKELQDELGLNMYDYGARNYDPALGRWMNIDPLAELAPNKSPYHFCSNNPVNRIDPTGLTDYKVNGETRTIDDGHNDVSMKVSERQFNRLQNKFDKGGSGYERMMNRMSVKNGFTTSGLYADSSASSGVGISFTQHKAGGDSYGQWSIQNNHQTYGTVEHIARVADSGLGAVTGQFGNINLGSNGSMYFRQNSGAIFRGNQYVNVTSAASRYSGLAKGAKWGGLATGVALGGYEIYQGVQQDGGTYGYNAQVQTAGALGGLGGGALGADIGAKIGAGIGVWFGGVGAVPGAIIGGLIGGGLGAWGGDYYGEQAAKAIIK